MVINLTSILSAPYGEFYFPDKYAKIKEFDPEKLNRQLIFDHDYHVDYHRRYNHQQQQQIADNSEEDQNSSEDIPQADGNSHQSGDTGKDENNSNVDDNSQEFDNHDNGQFDSNNGQFDSNSNNNGQSDSNSNNNGQSNNNFDWQNGNTNGFPRDNPAIANTVCESRCNTNVTPQYNPICGSNGFTYYNSGRLNCAQICGKSVSFVRMGSCSSALINNN